MLRANNIIQSPGNSEVLLFASAYVFLCLSHVSTTFTTYTVIFNSRLFVKKRPRGEKRSVKRRSFMSSFKLALGAQQFNLCAGSSMEETGWCRGHGADTEDLGSCSR